MDTKHRADVQNADTANFHVMPNQRIGTTNNGLAHMTDVNNIIGHHAVPTFDKVEYAFGLAHIAVAHVEHANAIDIDEAPVNNGMRRKELFEYLLRYLEKFKRMKRRGKKRDMQAVTHRLELVVRRLRMRHDPHRRTKYR